MLYSFKGQEPKPLPFRIRLPDGTTRTNPDTFTPEDIADAGYIIATERPMINQTTQTCRWDTTLLDWIITEITTEELNMQILAQEEEQRSRNKTIASELLEETDYMDLPNTSCKIVNITEIIEYRAALRAIALNPPTIIDTWPIKPPTIWS